MVPQRLSDSQIDAAMAEVPDWALVSGRLQRTFKFDDFVNAMAFVDRVASVAERAQHHPDILIRYNKVTLTLTTHDAGGITGKDFDLAQEADGLVPAGA
ncbi:MAG: 4a-hydroxytetrahydrobiopterin dehydratase [Phycisphaeraceae bacterium]|nr:4a-hydroxytetrahydrobiopterin dehydratase [Phycisphaeraceae bacterium]